jgi:hypothetical protein
MDETRIESLLVLYCDKEKDFADESAESIFIGRNVNMFHLPVSCEMLYHLSK